MDSSLLDYYRAIETASARMLLAARMDDWSEVVKLEGTCTVLIEQLRQRAKSEGLSPPQRTEKARIMQRILHNDAQIRCLADPWLAQFDPELPPSAPPSTTLH